MFLQHCLLNDKTLVRTRAHISSPLTFGLHTMLSSKLLASLETQ